mmetsp:Transcript_14513/g.21354  ORF Transcript_14513/g.21354 Transcript_14513/m.21354 type:complete len:596 (-) Transcript_14513:103-1890(-)|eukprot:CAMPEP_0194043758 /NCGR_PEP_ID=MMETSP0009_2-20130614/15330_1 /TAXON_ID=210454 /ORGANISM="Grammatophora oceanica, Strain CCMP 410" /LENGTH=595 /DNA_ID=CAMNT_0038688079 /DNA_START=41 /DNA_END=1831 /DNA_ORIENTATION=+
MTLDLASSSTHLMMVPRGLQFFITLGMAFMIFCCTVDAQRFRDFAPPSFHTGSVFHSTGATFVDSDYRDLAIYHFDSMSASIYLPYGGIWTDPTEDVNTEPLEAVIDFMEENEMLVHGHALVYPLENLNMPWWVAQDSSLVEERMYQYIDALAKVRAGKVYTWDVVNEVMGDDNNMNDSDGVRVFKFGTNNILKEYEAMGQDYIRRAFVRAREADPNAILLMTDYGCEWDDPDDPNQKSDRLYNFVIKLLSQGTPIDGIGFQMHVKSIEGERPNYSQIVRNFERFRNLGLEIHITEMDVQSIVTYDPENDPGVGPASGPQGDVYENIFQICMNEPACKSCMFWDYAEYNSRNPGLKHSWLHPIENSFNGLRDGQFTFPTPWWDINPESLSPKQAWSDMEFVMDAHIGTYRLYSRWESPSSYLIRNGSPLEDGSYAPAFTVGLATLNAESNEWTSMKWRLERVGDGSDRTYRLLCLWDSGSGYLTRSGVQVGEGDWEPTPDLAVLSLNEAWTSQLWQLEPVYEPTLSGAYKIKNLWSSNDNDYLTRVGLPDGNGNYEPTTDVNLIADADYDSQVWILDKVWALSETRGWYDDFWVD